MGKVWVLLCLILESVQFSCSVVSNSLWPHEPWHARPPCPSPSPGVHSDSMSIKSVMPSSHPILRRPLLTRTTALSNSMKLSHAVWGHPRRAGHGGEVWQNVVHWRREWQTTSVFLPWEPHEQYEKSKRWDTERWTPQIGRCPICY